MVIANMGRRALLGSASSKEGGRQGLPVAGHNRDVPKTRAPRASVCSVQKDIIEEEMR